MSATLCGLWPGPRRATAVLFDPVSKRLRPLSLASTEQARGALLAWLAEQPTYAELQARVPGDPNIGRAQYAVCAACHPSGKGGKSSGHRQNAFTRSAGGARGPGTQESFLRRRPEAGDYQFCCRSGRPGNQSQNVPGSGSPSSG